MGAIQDNALTISLGALLSLLMILIFYILLINSKINKLTKKYNYYMRGENGESLERKLSVEVKELREMASTISSMMEKQESLAVSQHQALQKVGFIKYNAFFDGGQQMSFSLTLLDGLNNGVCLSAICGRDESRVYAKAINDGKHIMPSSPEEEKSLAEALATVDLSRVEESKP